MSGAHGQRARRTGPRELSVEVTVRYRLMWGVVRALVRPLFEAEPRWRGYVASLAARGRLPHAERLQTPNSGG